MRIPKAPAKEASGYPALGLLWYLPWENPVFKADSPLWTDNKKAARPITRTESLAGIKLTRSSIFADARPKRR